MKRFFEHPIFLATALSLPFLAMGIWLTSLLGREVESKVFSVNVQGFDPRDLLSGHYLRYQVALDSPCPQMTSATKEVCACFDTKGVFPRFCESHECRYFIPGKCSGLMFFTDSLSRYFFPEELAKSLATVPDGATLQVRVGSGWAKAEQMFVGEVTIEDWARAKISKP